MNPTTKPVPPDPFKQFVQTVARMDTYDIAKDGEGHTQQQFDDALDTMNSLIQMARRITEVSSV